LIATSLAVQSPGSTRLGVSYPYPLFGPESAHSTHTGQQPSSDPAVLLNPHSTQTDPAQSTSSPRPPQTGIKRSRGRDIADVVNPSGASHAKKWKPAQPSASPPQHENAVPPTPSKQNIERDPMPSTPPHQGYVIPAARLYPAYPTDPADHSERSLNAPAQPSSFKSRGTANHGFSSSLQQEHPSQQQRYHSRPLHDHFFWPAMRDTPDLGLSAGSNGSTGYTTASGYGPYAFLPPIMEKLRSHPAASYR